MYLPSDLSTLSPNLTNVLLEIEKRLIRLEKYVAAPPVTPEMLSRLRDDWRRDLRAAIGEPGYRDWEEVFGSPTVVSRGGMILRPVSPSSLTVEATTHLQQPGCRLYHSADQSIPNDSPTIVAFDSEQWDRGDLHSTVTNNSRITINQTGKWAIGGNVVYAANNNGRRMMLLQIDGTTYSAAQGSAPFTSGGGVGTVTSNYPISIADQIDLTSGQYVELVAYQTSGGSLNVLNHGTTSPAFWAIYMGR
jgi:hypothetical protein